MTIINGGATGVIVQYKEEGKIYNSANVEAGASPDPFDEVRIPAGQDWELPANATIIAQRDLGGINPQGGTPDDGIDESAPTPTPTGTAIPGGQYGTPDENR
jgi:hypothetical protein